MRARIPAVPLISLFVLAPAMAQERGELFDRVVEVLQDRYYDRDFRRDELPSLAERYRPDALRARSRDEEREVVHGLLSEIPVSHLALYSDATHTRLIGGLGNKRAPTFGCELVQHDGLYFVSSVWEGGPADVAGLRRGDRVLRIDGDQPSQSPRLDWRSDDSHLPDPPLHAVLCNDGDVLELTVERRPGQRRTVVIEAGMDSAFDAARRSVGVIPHGDRTFGYVHFWLMHFTGVAQLMRDVIQDEFADCDGLVLDIRGRGGSAATVTALLRVLDRSWDRPIVVLIDRASRSAKEVLSWEIKRRGLGRLVGERTAGAVIPASFVQVGPESWLMFPQAKLGQYTREIEGIGVEPDVYVEAPGPYSAGADPIFDAGVEELVKMVMSTAAAGARVPVSPDDVEDLGEDLPPNTQGRTGVELALVEVRSR